MKNALLKLPTSGEIHKPDIATTLVGQIVEITEDSRAKIDYPGNPLEPVIARSVLRVPDYEDLLHAPVMLVFENGDPALPIIAGLVHEHIKTTHIHEVFDVPVEKQHKIALDGKRLVLTADKEIVLRCGKSSITLCANGRVVVKGKNLISRASASNKIKGACVNIN